jgi:hypothetical protein
MNPKLVSTDQSELNLAIPPLLVAPKAIGRSVDILPFDSITGSEKFSLPTLSNCNSTFQSLLNKVSSEPFGLSLIITEESDVPNSPERPETKILPFD